MRTGSGFFENAVGCIPANIVCLVCCAFVITGVLNAAGVFIITMYTVLGGFIIAGALGRPLI